MLGMPPPTNSEVCFNIVQKAVDPTPPLILNIYIAKTLTEFVNICCIKNRNKQIQKWIEIDLWKIGKYTFKSKQFYP